MDRLFFAIASLQILLFFHCHFCSATAFNAAESYAINCGSSGGSAASDGRKWIGDVRLRHPAFSIESRGKLISSSAVDALPSSDRIPYATALASRSDFTYAFKLNPGPKFIRLHFHPSSYGTFKSHSSLFTVKAGGYTLLNDFSPSIAADAEVLTVTKEFCISFGENQPLRITFSPSSDKSAFAFINGIEVISMPENLYYSNRLQIDETVALETTHRLNIGGKSIPAVEDTGMFRKWLNDSNFLLMESSVLPLATTLRIRYRSVPSYIAPQKIYQTSWSIDSYAEAKKNHGFTWKLDLDTGFRYLVRLHFCELDYEMKEIGQKMFSISIDNQTVEENGDLIQWGGEIGFAFYRDYVFAVDGGDLMQGKRDVLISIQPHLNNEVEMVDAIVKGMEVLKLSNPDNNLAGGNPNVPPRVYDSETRGFQMQASSAGFVVAAGLVSLVSYIFLGGRKEKKFSEKDINRGTEGEFKQCRSFSLKEIRKCTNNFSEEKVIRSDKFGTVYEGIIDQGTTKVEVRRLRFMQEEEEFTTVIHVLPKLKHEYLIDLIGYCRNSKKQEFILVYEHMAKGTFADHIFSTEEIANSPLSWEGRLKVLICSAKGFDYLHTTHNTIHRDVKSTSILLNEEFVPKISDFRLCIMKTTNDVTSHVSTDLKGTAGYLDPEYVYTRKLKKESDVYSFGVVMLEALCGRQAIKVGTRNERNLAIWAQQCYKDGTIESIIDPSIKRDISGPCLNVFTAIANKCIHSSPMKRPTMAEVAKFLEEAVNFQRQGNSVEKSEVDKVVHGIGIDNEQPILSIFQKEALHNVLNLAEFGPDSLFIALETYKAFSESFTDPTTLRKLGKKVKETLHEFEEKHIKLAKNKDKYGDSSHNKHHSLSGSVMDFMENLLPHKDTINSLRNHDTSILSMDDYFKSLVSTLKDKLVEIAKSSKEKLRVKFIADNREFIVRTVKGNGSFVGVLTWESVNSIFREEKPSKRSHFASLW